MRFKKGLLFAGLLIALLSCEKQGKTAKQAARPKYKGLNGTWIHHDPVGFSLIEIKDTDSVTFYGFTDRQKRTNRKLEENRYWFYKSKAKMGYWNSNSIWISTDKFRFDYRINGDTLIEYDKMGDQGKFVKVYNEK